MTFGQGHSMTLTSRISKELNLNAFSYQRAQLHQQNAFFHFFPIPKPKVPNLTFSFNRSRSIQCLHFHEFYGASPKNNTYQVSSQSIGQVVLEEISFKVFTIDGHGSHFGLVTWTKYINRLSLFAWSCI